MPGCPRPRPRQRAVEMLAKVGIPDPAQRLRAYPHELSGGMRQRVMIAMALINDPALLVADEATTALDVTTQAQILDLLRDLCRRANSAVVLITHDLGVVAEVCDEVVVMYAGRVVERGSVEAVLERPSHPYTWGLLGSMPSVDPAAARSRTIARHAAVTALHPPSGCRFHPRCPHALDRCRTRRSRRCARRPTATAVHTTACHLDDAPAQPGRRRRLGALNRRLVMSPGNGARGATAARGRRPGQGVPRRPRAVRHARRRPRGRRRVVLARTPARRWRSSASPAAARARSPAACCAC